MSLHHSVLWIIVLWSMALNAIQTLDNQYTFKKAVELQETQLPSEFTIEINDRVLISAEQVNVTEPVENLNPGYSPDHQLDRYINSTTSQTQTYKFYVYMGKLYEKLVNAYPWDGGQTDGIGFSDSAIFGVIDADNIKSHPYLNSTVLKIPNVKSILSVRPDYKLLSVLNKSNNCQYIVGIQEFENQAKNFVYNGDQTNCPEAKNAQMVNLGFGLIGHQMYDTIQIIFADNVTNVLQKVNISGASRMEILNVIPFYDKKDNYSMFSIQAGGGDNYTLYEFDHNVQKYFVTNQFFNPGSACNYFNKDTCVAIFDHKQVVIENIHRQLVHKALNDTNLSNLTSTKLLSISHNAKYVVGFSSSQMKLKVFNMGSGYNFTLVDSIPVSSELGDCMSDAKFTVFDGKVMAHIENCNGSAEKKKSNICLFEILDPSLHTPTCIRKIDEKVDSNFTSPILITKTEVENAKRVCLGKWAYNANSYTIECRDTVDLSLLTSYPQTLNDSNHKLVNMKLMHCEKATNTFFAVIQVVSPDSNTTINITHKYQLVANFEKTDIKIERKKQFIEPIKISFELSAVYNEYIISLSLKEGSDYNCALFFVDMDGVVHEREFNYQCVSYNKVAKPFRLLIQEGFDQVCLQSMDKYDYGLIDCYKEYSEGAKIRRRSIPMPLFNPNFAVNPPLIDPLNNTIMFYDSSTDTPSIMMFNIQEAPFIMTDLKANVYVSTFISFLNSYRNQFAYSTPAWNDQIEDEILAFTQFTTLRKIRNPVNRSREIFRTMHPANYSIDEETFDLWHPDALSIKWQSKTFLASTGYHIIIPIKSQSVNHTYLYYLELNQLFEKQRPLRPTWNYTEESIVNQVDLGWNCFAIIANDNQVKIEPYVFHDKLGYHEIGNNTHYERVFSTNDDRIALTIHEPVTNYSVLFYYPSILKKEARLIELKRPGKILKTIISPNDESFLVETEKYIQFVAPGRSESFSVEKMSDFVQMHLTVDPNKKFKNQGWKQSDSQSLEDILREFESLEFDKEYSSLPAQKIQKRLNSLLKGKFSPSAKKVFSKLKYATSAPQIDYNPPTIIIRCTNYTLFCPVFLILSQCSNFSSINGGALFATNREGNGIGYLWKDEKQTEWVHIMKVLSFGNIQSVQNVSLKELKGANSTLMYKPDTKKLFMSSSSSLYVLTVAKENKQKFTKPVLYVFTTGPCEKNQLLVNGECQCNTNYSVQEKYGSQVMECIECNCMLRNDTNGNCVCPISKSFMYDPVRITCECDHDSDRLYNAEIGQYCEKKGNGWWIVLWIVVGLIGLAGIVFSSKKCWNCYIEYKKQEKKRLQDELNRLLIEDGTLPKKDSVVSTLSEDNLNDPLPPKKQSSENIKPLETKDWIQQRGNLTGENKKKGK